MQAKGLAPASQSRAAKATSQEESEAPLGLAAAGDPCATPTVRLICYWGTAVSPTTGELAVTHTARKCKSRGRERLSKSTLTGRSIDTPLPRGDQSKMRR